MEKQENKRDQASLPDTTRKVAGTTSAFSAASAERSDAKTDAERKKYLEDGEQGRATFVSGTTSQGGSNYGQGSSALGPSSYQQGAKRSRGSNYENEYERFADTGTQGSGYAPFAANIPHDPRKQGGTDSEHDEMADRDDTIGIP